MKDLCHCKKKGTISKAKKILDWQPEVTFKELVKVMVEADLRDLEEMKHCQDVVKTLIKSAQR